MPRSHFLPDLPSGPPPEVLDEIGAAWERAQEPWPEGLRLDFGSEPGNGRAWGELRLGDGTLVELLPASDALALACGDAVVQPPPALAV